MARPLWPALLGLALLTSIGCTARDVVTAKPRIASLSVPSLTRPVVGATWRWRATIAGGVGPVTYEFSVRGPAGQAVVQSGHSATWDWTPIRPGVYSVQVTARDSLGYSASSDWSPAVDIRPALSRSSPVAIFPFEDFSGRSAPLEAIRGLTGATLALGGVSVLDESTLDAFLARHRVRYSGGVPSELARVLGEETGSAAVLLGTVEQYVDGDSPKLALHYRLVATGERAIIVLADGVALAGAHAPGAFDLGRVRSVDTLIERAAARLTESVARVVDADERAVRGQADPDRAPVPRLERRFRPEGFFSSATPTIVRGDSVRVAVLPFDNESRHPDAGQLMSLHFLRALAGRPRTLIVEPGDVRQSLLESRMIMNDGPSLPETDLLRALLDVDFVVAGTVSDYEDPAAESGVPEIAFSVRGIRAAERRVGWSSVSHARGDDGFRLFDRGRLYTAHELATRMVAQVAARTGSPTGRVDNSIQSEVGGSTP